MSKLITLEERKKLIELIDYIEDEETKRLIRKLFESYNRVYAYLSEETKKEKKSYLLEIKYNELMKKYTEKENTVKKLRDNLNKEIKENIENYKKFKGLEAENEKFEKLRKYLEGEKQ